MKSEDIPEHDGSEPVQRGVLVEEEAKETPEEAKLWYEPRCADSTGARRGVGVSQSHKVKKSLLSLYFQVRKQMENSQYIHDPNSQAHEYWQEEDCER